MDLASMRRDYARTGLSEADLAPDWLTQLQRWLGEAVATQTETGGIVEPNAMVLATVDELGHPTTRTVLLKGLDERGLTFFTNYTSRKGRQLADRPYASVTFPWFALTRQVSVTGTVERVAADETRAYHQTRPRDSQLGAWASPQSSVVADRAALDAALAEVTARFADTEVVPVPPHWGGLRIRPETVEFWQGRHGRLHDRLRYRLVAGDNWIIERLAP